MFQRCFYIHFQPYHNRICSDHLQSLNHDLVVDTNALNTVDDESGVNIDATVEEDSRPDLNSTEEEESGNKQNTTEER